MRFILLSSIDASRRRDSYPPPGVFANFFIFLNFPLPTPRLTLLPPFLLLASPRRRLYSWGTCKTPNNSVTAALSQDTTFVRIAPSTYALRSTLKGGAGPVPQARTSSGSINSGAPTRTAAA